MAGEISSSRDRALLLRKHKQERDGRLKDRIKVVLLHDDDWSYASIAEALFLSDEGVRQQLKDYETSGKLKPENGGSESLLTSAQIAELLAHLELHLYAKTSDIFAFAHQKFGVRYSVRGMTDLIKSRGFSFHQPVGVPAKTDAKA